MGGSGGFFPPTGVWGQSPQWGFRGQRPLPPIVPTGVQGATPPASYRSNGGSGGNAPCLLSFQRGFRGQRPLPFIVPTGVRGTESPIILYLCYIHKLNVIYSPARFEDFRKRFRRVYSRETANRTLY